jgi:hypothetical protein
MSSQRKIDANRRNARKSTGPRSAAGKARASANGRRHFCNQMPIIPGECDNTFLRIQAELDEELHPRTPLQQCLFDQIVNCEWRLMRINDIERQLLLNEARRMEQEGGEPAPPCTVMAHVMEKGPRNALASLWRYQMQLQSMQLKLIKQFWWQKKHHPLVDHEREEIEALQAVRRSSERWEADRRAKLAETDRYLREQEEEQYRADREAALPEDNGRLPLPPGAGWGEGGVQSGHLPQGPHPDPLPRGEGNGMCANEPTASRFTGQPVLIEVGIELNEPAKHLNGNGQLPLPGGEGKIGANEPTVHLNGNGRGPLPPGEGWGEGGMQGGTFPEGPHPAPSRGERE